MTSSSDTRSIATALEGPVRDWLLEGSKSKEAPRARFEPHPRWRAVRDAGTELWLDTGDMDGIRKLWSADFSALTTNNTLLNKEVQRGQYDDLVRRTAARLREAAPGIGERDLLLEIAFVLNAHHALRLVDTFDAMVSVEEHTDLANELDLAVLYGKRFHAICPERFYVKLPLTPAGLLGMRKLGKAGVPVNFTLGFSARQNVLAACIGNPTYVNVFLGRLNSFVADHKLGSGDGVGEKATAASQEAIAALRREGRAHTKQIAASMRNGEQVWSLAGVDVMTIPLAAAQEYRDSSQPPVAKRGSAASAFVPDVKAGPLRSLMFEKLWDVPAEFRRAVDQVCSMDLDGMQPQNLVDAVQRAGISDVLPAWSAADLATIRTDGKIPKLDRWREKIERGHVGLDALFNISGLESFALDQQALDDRVRGLL